MYKFIGKPGQYYELEPIKLNYKCEKGTVDDTNKCKLEDTTNTEEQANQIKSMMNHNDKYYGFKSKMRANVSNPVKLDKLSPKNVPILNKNLQDLQSRCKQLGLPRLRGVIVEEPSEKALASMADGILALSDDALRNNEQEMLGILKERNKKIIEFNTKRLNTIYAYMEGDKERFMKNNPGGSWERSWIQKEWLQREGDNIKRLKNEIETSKSRLNDLETNYVDALINKWKPGDDKSKRPFSVDEYFNMSNRPKLVLDHEFGHHIHQQMGVKDKDTFKNPQIEQDIKKLYNTERKDFISPSKYADSDPEEWFAESYSLHVNGRDDLIDKKLLKYFKEKKL